MYTRLPASLLPLFLLSLGITHPAPAAAAPGAPAALTALSLPGPGGSAKSVGEKPRKEAAAPGRAHPFTFEDMVHLQRIGEFHLSPAPSGASCC